MYEIQEQLTEGMMLIEDRFFEQAWVQEMSNEDFRMLLYLMHSATKKCGIVELNMRMLNFAANTGHIYTQAEVLQRFGNMICMIPGKENTAIFPNWIATNWAKNGKPIDADRNPLFKSVVQELASYGLTIAKLNKMAKMKVILKGESDDSIDDTTDRSGDGLLLDSGQVENPFEDLDKMFESFWQAYPSSCPRKVDKKKCREKFTALAKKHGDAVQFFNKVMDGLNVWKRCSTWNSDNGKFIRAPLVWLNNESWNDTPAANTFTDRASAEAALAEAKEQKFRELVRKLKPKDWDLCREWCANCTACGCRCGIKVPPDKDRNPRPPKECPKFKPL